MLIWFRFTKPVVKVESLTIGLMCVMMSLADRRLPGSTVVQ